MRIIQLTDIHVSEKGIVSKDGVDTRKNLKRVLKAISKEHYDLLVLTGDTCFDLPNEKIYKWVVKRFKKKIDLSKFRLISGNHDDTLMMCKAFDINENITADEYYFVEKLGQYDFIFLDTAKGHASKNQKEWLQNLLKSDAPENVYVFIHHPPLEAGIPFMDNNYALTDMEDFQKIFQAHPETTFQIFCGHYHVDESVSQHNMNVFVSPSCYFQLDGSKEDFAIDHFKIGYRVIEIDDEGKMITFVKYLE